jgi:phage-related protein
VPAWRIEYYADAGGREPVSDYLEALRRSGEKRGIAACEHALEMLEEHGPLLGMPRSRIIDRKGRIYELRAGDHRIAYVQRGQRFVMLHAWRKRSQRLDAREAERASRLAREI